MRRKREHDTSLEGPVLREMEILIELQRTPLVSQRELARRVGIALKVTNLIMRQLVQKGYMRARRASWRSWLYTVAPAGFLRRTELAATYVQRLLGHLQSAKQLLEEELTSNGMHPESRVAILGTGELAQLVYLALKDLGIDDVDIFDANKEYPAEMLTMAWIKPAFRLDDYDRVVLASLADTETEWRKLQEMGVPREKVIPLFGSTGKQRQACQPQLAGGWRND